MSIGGVGRSENLLAVSYAQRGARAEGAPGEEAGESPAVEQTEAETPHARALAAAWSMEEPRKVDLLA